MLDWRCGARCTDPLRPGAGREPRVPGARRRTARRDRHPAHGTEHRADVGATRVPAGAHTHGELRPLGPLRQAGHRVVRPHDAGSPARRAGRGHRRGHGRGRYRAGVPARRVGRRADGRPARGHLPRTGRRADPSCHERGVGRPPRGVRRGTGRALAGLRVLAGHVWDRRHHHARSARTECQRVVPRLVASLRAELGDSGRDARPARAVRTPT